MPFARERLMSSLNGKMGNTCCSTSSIAKQVKAHASLSDDFSIQSQSTAITEALSMESSLIPGSIDSRFKRTLPVLASSNIHLPMKSSLKRNIASSRLSKDIRIKFSYDVVQRKIMGRHEFSEDELDACWFRGDEYASITKSCLKEIQKLQQGAKLKDHKYCARGLESHTQLAGLAKAQNRRAAWDAVLFEQDEQIDLGVVDEESIGSRYQDVSSSSHLWAVKMALDDQRAAQLVYEDEIDEVITL